MASSFARAREARDGGVGEVGQDGQLIGWKGHKALV